MVVDQGLLSTNQGKEETATEEEAIVEAMNMAPEMVREEIRVKPKD